MNIIARLAFSISMLLIATGDKGDIMIVKAKVKPDRSWKEYETRTIDQLPDFTPGAKPVAFSKFGGWLDRKTEATGFFYVREIDGRWWLVDPEGYLFIHVGVCAVRPGKTEANRTALKEKFGTKEKWAEATVDLLREYGFNGTGSWSDTELLRRVPHPPVYTAIWNFMSRFGSKKRMTRQLPGHAGYPKDSFPVFHPEFEQFCDERARELAAVKDDPYLLGHFSDNEMPLPDLKKYLSLDPNIPDLEHGYMAAKEWLAKRKGSEADIDDITDEDQEAWVEYVYSRYFEITTGAIRKCDPNHLCLGPRFHGRDRRSPGAWKAAGKYLDVIAINYYGVWTPDQETIGNWLEWSGKPFMVTEYYTKGMDSGYPNTTGAGWIVETQDDRGLFYQNYVLALLESKSCVGWHWFKYMDNDPADLSTDPSNRDSNKGIVTIRYEEYRPLLDRMKTLNRDVYRIIQYFDGE
jgi:hypothetical protein